MKKMRLLNFHTSDWFIADYLFLIVHILVILYYMKGVNPNATLHTDSVTGIKTRGFTFSYDFNHFASFQPQV